MSYPIRTRPGVQNIDDLATSLGTSRDNILSGDSTDIIMRVDSYQGTALLQCITSTSLQAKVYISLDGGTTFTAVVSGSNGSSNVAADTAIVLSAGSLVTWDCVGATHVKVSRTAGTGTIQLCAVPFSGSVGSAGANAVLAAATINEDTAAASLEILMKGAEVRRDTPVASGANGDWCTPNQDANGAHWVTLAALIAGENLTTNRMMVEHAYSSSAVMTGDTQVKSGAGFLHTVTISCNDAAPTAGTLIIYDNTAESGTVLFNHTFTTTPFMPFTITLDVAFATGLYFGFTTTADVNVVCSYR